MIDILIPSRGRPERLRQTILSAMQKASGNSMIKFYVYLDHDDTNTIQNLHLFHYDYRITWVIGQPHILSNYWNVLYKIGSGEILFHGADDIIFETKGWDELVINHFKEHLESLYYGFDGHQNQNCPTHSFTSRSAADKVGYFLPPYFEADFNDVWLKEVYTKAGRIYYNSELAIRHLHRNVDMKYDDETYRIAEERRKRAATVWEEKKHEIDEDVKKLIQ